MAENENTDAPQTFSVAQLVAMHSTLYAQDTFWSLDAQGNKKYHEITFAVAEDEHDPDTELTLVFFQDVTAQMKEAAV